MNRRLRSAIFAAGVAPFLAVLVWGLAGLPDFGHYPGPYGDVIVRLADPQRHIANAVTAVVFDYRGLDTMGEELILFAAASAMALLLRDTRESDARGIVDAIRSDGTRALGALAAVAGVVLALNVVSHGFLTPGGGFQGGVVLAAAVLLVFLGVEYHAFHAIAPAAVAEPAESLGAGGYVAVGLVSLGLGLSFLQNFMGLGRFGRLESGGTALLVNWAAALAVAGGFLVIFGELLQENMAARHR